MRFQLPPRFAQIRVLLPVAIAFVLAGSVYAQRFRSGVDLVSLNVTVTNGTHYVTDLEEAEFEVFEDGVKQPLTFFSRVQQPIALAVLLDTSASMEGKLATAQEAAIGFARRLRKTDVMQVIEFDSQVNIVQEFTSDIPTLEKAIQSTTVNGSTSLYNAIYIALKNLRRNRAKVAEEIRREAIVVLSDGDDTSSLIEYRGSSRSREAFGDGDLFDRLASGQRGAQRVQGGGVRYCGSCRRRPADACSSPPPRPSYPKSTNRSRTSSPVSTHWRTRRRTRCAMARGVALPSEWRGPV